MDVTPTKQIPQVKGAPLLGSLNDFRNNRLEFFKRISRECPEIGSFKVGPARITLITSSKLANEVLSTQSDIFWGGKLIQAIVPLMGQNSLFLLHAEEHRQQRKLMAHAFTPRNIGELAPTMVDYVHQMVERWADGSVVDITQEMTLLTMRIVGKTLFDVDFAHEAHEFDQAMHTSLEYLEYLTSSLVPIPLSIPLPRNVRTRKALSTIRDRLQAMVAERRGNTQKKDLLSTLANFKDETGEGLSDDQLKDHAATIFVAGHETVAMTMSWAWYLLQQHPDIYSKMRQEVDSVLGGRLPTLEDLQRLGYTMQVVKEAMRLYPPGYFLTRTAMQDTTLDGYPLKKGDIIAIAPYTLHRDESFYPDPEKFLPERFAPEEEKKRPRYAYIPFSAGPHTCLGYHFALMEAHLIMAIMVQRTVLEAVPGQTVVANPGVSLRMSSYQLRVTRRQAEAAGKAAVTG